MRKLLLMVCALFGFMACTQNPIEEQSAIRTDAPETIRVGFEDDETRIQLNSAQKTVWTKGDLVSVFYRSDANQKWQYQGETGERVGDLKRVENATSTTKTTKTVVVYPYSESYWLNTDTFAIDATLPATQYYAESSYGIGSNLMVSQSEFTQFSLKSVCGWLKLQLTGDGEVVKSIKFRGNDGEQVAGLIYVDTATAEATLASEMGGTDDNNAGGNLVFDDTILTEVVLDCGEGVELGSEATEFYISLPPQTFENGFTVNIECQGYEPMNISTEKPLVIERNTIQPMASVEHNAPYQLPNNEIWYTNGSTTTPTEPTYKDVFGANIISNTYDATKECWVIKFDGDVTAIGDDAFFYSWRLTSVTIPDSVTSIGSAAFWSCHKLTSVNIPNNVTKIGDRAFLYCSSLTSVTIPDSVTTIEPSAFRGCSWLSSVTIGESVTTIGDHAFRNCSSLTEFKGKWASVDGVCLIINDTLHSFAIGSGVTEYIIPDGVTTIGEGAFDNCNSLTSVTIPNSVTTVGNSAFASCFNLQKFNGKFASEDGRCLIVDGVLNSFAPAGLTEYTVSSSVTSIGVGAFCDCSRLEIVSIPDSVTSIGASAFENCNGLTCLTFSDSVTIIGYGAFSDCSSLTSVYIGDLSAWCRVEFDYLANPLSSGANLYLNNELVTELIIPSDITEIKSYAFQDCNSLTNVVISDNVTTIGECAFNDCSNLSCVTISDSVTNIEQHAFMNCPSLTSVYCKAIVPPAGSLWMLNGNASDRKIYVPTESVEAYKSAGYWSEYADAIVGYNF